MFELFSQNPWLPSCLEQISLHLIELTPFGLKARMVFGASLSCLDVISDLGVTKMYYDEGRGSLATITLSLIGLSACLQCGLVYINNKAKPAGTLMKELLITITFTKPIVDAYRVANGKIQQPGEVLSPLSDMLGTKMCEIFGESIPGLVVQVVALVNAPVVSSSGQTLAILSIILSAVSTGFASSMISYDLDVDVNKRRNNPKFYGYVPDADSARTIVFTAMTMLSSCFVLSKTFAIGE